MVASSHYEEIMQIRNVDGAFANPMGDPHGQFLYRSAAPIIGREDLIRCRYDDLGTEDRSCNTRESVGIFPGGHMEEMITQYNVALDFPNWRDIENCVQGHKYPEENICSIHNHYANMCRLMCERNEDCLYFLVRKKRTKWDQGPCFNRDDGGFGKDGTLEGYSDAPNMSRTTATCLQPFAWKDWLADQWFVHKQKILYPEAHYERDALTPRTLDVEGSYLEGLLTIPAKYNLTEVEKESMIAAWEEFHLLEVTAVPFPPRNYRWNDWPNGRKVGGSRVHDGDCILKLISNVKEVLTIIRPPKVEGVSYEPFRSYKLNKLCDPLRWHFEFEESFDPWTAHVQVDGHTKQAGRFAGDVGWNHGFHRPWQNHVFYSGFIDKKDMPQDLVFPGMDGAYARNRTAPGASWAWDKMYPEAFHPSTLTCKMFDDRIFVGQDSDYKMFDNRHFRTWSTRVAPGNHESWVSRDFAISGKEGGIKDLKVPYSWDAAAGFQIQAHHNWSEDGGLSWREKVLYDGTPNDIEWEHIFGENRKALGLRKLSDKESEWLSLFDSIQNPNDFARAGVRHRINQRDFLWRPANSWYTEGCIDPTNSHYAFGERRHNRELAPGQSWMFNWDREEGSNNMWIAQALGRRIQHDVHQEHCPDPAEVYWDGFFNRDNYSKDFDSTIQTIRQPHPDAAFKRIRSWLGVLFESYVSYCGEEGWHAISKRLRLEPKDIEFEDDRTKLSTDVEGCDGQKYYFRAPCSKYSEEDVPVSKRARGWDAGLNAPGRPHCMKINSNEDDDQLSGKLHALLLDLFDLDRFNDMSKTLLPTLQYDDPEKWDELRGKANLPCWIPDNHPKAAMFPDYTIGSKAFKENPLCLGHSDNKPKCVQCPVGLLEAMYDYHLVHLWSWVRKVGRPSHTDQGGRSINYAATIDVDPYLKERAETGFEDPLVYKQQRGTGEYVNLPPFTSSYRDFKLESVMLFVETICVELVEMSVTNETPLEDLVRFMFDSSRVFTGPEFIGGDSRSYGGDDSWKYLSAISNTDVDFSALCGGVAKSDTNVPTWLQDLVGSEGVRKIATSLFNAEREHDQFADGQSRFYTDPDALSKGVLDASSPFNIPMRWDQGSGWGFGDHILEIRPDTNMLGPGYGMGNPWCHWDECSGCTNTDFNLCESRPSVLKSLEAGGRMNVPKSCSEYMPPGCPSTAESNSAYKVFGPYEGIPTCGWMNMAKHMRMNNPVWKQLFRNRCHETRSSLGYGSKDFYGDRWMPSGDKEWSSWRTTNESLYPFLIDFEAILSEQRDYEGVDANGLQKGYDKEESWDSFLDVHWKKDVTWSDGRHLKYFDIRFPKGKPNAGRPSSHWHNGWYLYQALKINSDERLVHPFQMKHGKQELSPSIPFEFMDFIWPTQFHPDVPVFKRHWGWPMVHNYVYGSKSETMWFEDSGMPRNWNGGVETWPIFQAQDVLERFNLAGKAGIYDFKTGEADEEESNKLVTPTGNEMEPLDWVKGIYAAYTEIKDKDVAEDPVKYAWESCDFSYKWGSLESCVYMSNHYDWGIVRGPSGRIMFGPWPDGTRPMWSTTTTSTPSKWDLDYENLLPSYQGPSKLSVGTAFCPASGDDIYYESATHNNAVLWDDYFKEYHSFELKITEANYRIHDIERFEDEYTAGFERSFEVMLWIKVDHPYTESLDRVRPDFMPATQVWIDWNSDGIFDGPRETAIPADPWYPIQTNWSFNRTLFIRQFVIHLPEDFETYNEVWMRTRVVFPSKDHDDRDVRSAGTYEFGQVIDRMLKLPGKEFPAERRTACYDALRRARPEKPTPPGLDTTGEYVNPTDWATETVPAGSQETTKDYVPMTISPPPTWSYAETSSTLAAAACAAGVVALAMLMRSNYAQQYYEGEDIEEVEAAFRGTDIDGGAVGGHELIDAEAQLF